MEQKPEMTPNLDVSTDKGWEQARRESGNVVRSTVNTGPAKPIPMTHGSGMERTHWNGVRLCYPN